MRTGLIAGVAALIVVMIFIIQNARAVNISFLGAHLHLSLAVALLLAAIAGALAHGRRRNRPDHPAAPDHATQPAQSASRLKHPGQSRPAPLACGPEKHRTAFPPRSLPRNTGYRLSRTPRTSLTKESVMGIIAWIVLGLVAGLLANMLIPGKRSQGLILTCLIGIAGALGGGWAATELFHVHTLNGFFNLSTWLTAIAGSAVLLLVSHLFTGRSGKSRRFAHR